MTFFEEKISAFYSKEICEKIIMGSSVDRSTTLRVNLLKTNVDYVCKILNNENIEYAVSPFSPIALIIKNGENRLRETSLYKNGEIYLQSLSSQLPVIALSPKEKEDILDMTAAPGGKTGQIAALCNNKCNITACEMNLKRAERLKYNLNKQGVNCANVMTIDARRLESYFSFDRILLDAPCSGSGTLNLNTENKGFTDILIKKCVASQNALLDKALTVLKPGGEMVYSTCSILPCENEEIIKNAAKKHHFKILPIDEELRNNLPLLPCSLDNALCVAPTKDYEGFFVVKIKKNR